MYQQFFGLTDMPFELTANPRFLFLTSKHREALSVLEYGLFSAKPITVLIGEAGTGKTTLIRAALESKRCRGVRCVYVDNPVLCADDFVRLLALKFGLGADTGTSKSIVLDRLESALRERRARGEITALVVDEAHTLSGGLLEELRLLANMETPSQKLLPLVLAGQPELGERLEDPALRQLKQRVTLRSELTPFDMAETAAYIAARVQVAGGAGARLFTRDAVTLVHEYSRGLPRSINVICDNALLNAMALRRRSVDTAIVVEVCRDLKLGSAQRETAPAAQFAAPWHSAPVVGMGRTMAAEAPAAASVSSRHSGLPLAVSVWRRWRRFTSQFGEPVHQTGRVGK
jgi:general secretion pathway protein A